MAKFTQYPSSNEDVAQQLRNLIAQLNSELKIQSPIEVTEFLNSWENYGDEVYSDAAYYMKDRRVYLSGLVKTGTIGTPVFVLPIGYRPTGQLIFATVSNSSFAELRVSENGEVTPVSGNNAWVSLENISFRID